MDTKSESALEFLHGLETRHTQVLDELELLNAHIEKVLQAYAQARNPQPPSDSKVEAI